MPETTPQVDNNATQGATAEKTFTQAEMDAIIGDRLARERAKYADYAEIKAKAAKFDEAEEANKSELQKAVEERDALKARIDKLEADKAHADAVADAAAKYGVDAALLSRMSGDVEENAAILKEKMGNAPKYGNVADGGEVKAPADKKTNGEVFADTIKDMFK
jgi:hypothetical protein